MNLQGITFRQNVVPDDIERIKKLSLSTGMFRYDEVKVAIDLVLDHLVRKEYSGYFFIIAEKGKDETVGFTCFGPIACTQGRFDLYWIVVHPQYQRKGIGSLLLKMSEQNMSSMGAKRVYIETSSRENYSSTRLFYEQQGYTIASEVEGFYSDNDDKIIFVKSIA